jgi:thymidylate synthase (FAD)
MGDDRAIVQAARTSYGEGTKGDEADKKLIDYLYKNRHTSPFEMVEFKFHAKMPMFVARQWVRHRTANINEVSARYTQLTDDYYVPDSWRKQDKVNRQGSTDDISEHQGKVCDERLMDVCDLAFERYEELISFGVAREQARMILPVNWYTEWYWKCDLHNILNFLRLRLDSHAQYEIRVYAEAMLELIAPIVPWTLESFRKHTLGEKNV